MAYVEVDYDPFASAPIGVRNNNPGNLRPNGQDWQGQTGQAGGFMTFQSPEMGLRAASKNLVAYAKKGINTPRAIAATWAPSSDGNDPESYARTIAAELKVNPDTALNLNNPDVNSSVLRAITKHENGYMPVSNQQIGIGTSMATGKPPQKYESVDYDPFAGGTPSQASSSEIPRQQQPLLDTASNTGSLHEQMLANANMSMAGEKAPLLGIPATLTGYGANAMQAIPFADEIGSGIAARLGFGQGNDFSQRYANLQQSQQVMREAQRQNEPRIETPSYLPDITPSGVGQTAATIALTPFMPGPAKGAATLGGAAAKGSAIGASYGATYGAGDTNSFLSDQEAAMERGGNLLKSGAMGAALGAPLGAIGHGLTPKPAQIKADDIRAQATQTYQAASQKGGMLKPDFTDDFLNKAAQAKPQTLAGQVTVGEDEATKLLDRWDVLRGKPLDLQSAQEMDQGLTQLMNKDVDRLTGKMGSEGKKLYDLQTLLRDKIENASPNEIVGSREGFDLLKQGRKLWSDQARLRDVENIVERAKMTDNPVSSLRTGFKNLYTNKGRMRGFSLPQQAAIKNAANTGVFTDLMRVFGSRLGSIITTSVGGAFGGVGGLPGAIAAGTAAHGLSSAARATANALQMGKAQNVINQITGNIPKQLPIHPVTSSIPFISSTASQKRKK